MSNNSFERFWESSCTQLTDFDERQARFIWEAAQRAQKGNLAKAAAELTAAADDLKQCSTINGEWDGTDELAREEYDRLMAVVFDLTPNGPSSPAGR